MKISDAGMQVVSQNKRYAVCKCPLHNDKHASAVVYLDTMVFTCFVCHITKPLEQVLKEAGLESEGFDITRQQFVMPDLIEDSFRFTKPTTRALEYLNERGVDTTKLPPYVVSPLLDNGVGFLFSTMSGKPLGMQVRLFPEYVSNKSVRYILYGQRTEMFGVFTDYRRGKYPKLAVFEKAFGALKAQQVSDASKLGVATVSSAGSNIQRNLLNLVGIDAVFFLDNDSAGRRTADFIHSRGFRVIVPKNPVDEMNRATLTGMLQKVFSV